MPIHLKSLIYKETDFTPKTLGEHLKKHRLILKLRQQDVARRIGVGELTVQRWETGQKEVHIKCMPKVLEFLGYNPLPSSSTLSERMLAFRQAHGWSINMAARYLGVDPEAWGRWERTGYIPWKRYRDLIEAQLVNKS